ncbi:MAG: peptidoglycan editing factor PgeF [Pseudomonadota bacterium]
MTGPPHQTSHIFAREKEIRHGFFGRRGGVSEGLYGSLNLGEGSADAAAAIRANRERVRQTIGATHLLSCFQTHSADVVTVKEPWLTRPRGDAMVTDRPGLALCILTADCVPVLFADPGAGVIGAAHAGWRGALCGVCEATLGKMEALGAKRSHIRAAIGPAIQQQSYEVGPEFRDTWLSEHAWTESHFRVGRADRFQFDLTGYVETILNREGLGTIERLPDDTCSMVETYFSNRRRNQRGEADYGRNGSVIMLTSD